ncbi:hypothetical protein [Methylomagnum sp.]
MEYPKETFEERLVFYPVDLGDSVCIVEHVPAKVCRETGELLFSPETVERIQRIIREQSAPARVIETLVYDFAA